MTTKLGPQTVDALERVKQDILDPANEFSMYDWNTCIGGRLREKMGLAHVSDLGLLSPNGQRYELFWLGGWPTEIRAQWNGNFLQRYFGSPFTMNMRRRRAAAAAIDYFIARDREVPDKPTPAYRASLPLRLVAKPVENKENKEEVHA